MIETFEEIYPASAYRGFIVSQGDEYWCLERWQDIWRLTLVASGKIKEGRSRRDARRKGLVSGTRDQHHDCPPQVDDSRLFIFRLFLNSDSTPTRLHG